MARMPRAQAFRWEPVEGGDLWQAPTLRFQLDAAETLQLQERFTVVLQEFRVEVGDDPSWSNKLVITNMFGVEIIYINQHKSTPISSSFKKGAKIQRIRRMGAGEVIKGWEEGLLRMSQGEKARLGVRSDYAYGAMAVLSFQEQRTWEEVGSFLGVK